jgi:hypothetical protein
MDKIGGFGYFSCLGRHCYVRLMKDDNNKQFVDIEGWSSRTVDDLFDHDEKGNLVIWKLVEEVEGELKYYFSR